MLAADTGKGVKQFASLRGRNLPIVQWAYDSESFLYLETNENPTLMRQTIDDQTPAKLKEWKSGKIYQFALSEGGKRIFYEKGDEVNSIIQLQNIPVE